MIPTMMFSMLPPGSEFGAQGGVTARHREECDRHQDVNDIVHGGKDGAKSPRGIIKMKPFLVKKTLKPQNFARCQAFP